MSRYAALAIFSLAAATYADEKGAERAFNLARRTEPQLIAFLKGMPKGGDLHSHVSGAVYADAMLDAAIKKGLFFDPATSRFTTDATKTPAKNLLKDNALLYSFMNAASMRGWMGGGESGHDHFFETFGIFGGALDAMTDSDIYAQVIGRAKAQNLQYMELMAGPVPSPASTAYMRDLPSSEDMPKALEALRPRFAALLEATKKNLDERDAMAARIGQRSYTGIDQPMTVRWIYSINRLAPNDTFFASAAAGMFLAKNELRVAAMNMVAPEDHPLSRTNFPRQMQMLDFLWKNLGHPNLTLHAGELTTAISPPDAMRDRIRKTIEMGHARRIGHGVSIAWEDDLPGLFKEMRQKGVAVEICLTSNRSILGVSGDRHPFRLYREAHVPVFLNTDDEGVSRTTMTQEWVRAVREQGVSYRELKEMARNSIQYSFLPGKGLYDKGGAPAALKGFDRLGWKPGPEAIQMLKSSEKMRVQMRLERALVSFESRF